MSFFVFIPAFAVLVFISRLIASRAKRSGRRYWLWFILSFVGGPLGQLIVFLLLEAANQKRREREEMEGEVSQPEQH